METPGDLLYTDEHEWIKKVGDGTVRIGVTDYAQDQLGDVVFVELPETGREVAKDDLVVEIESTKSVGEVYAPFAGKISAV
ncbi:MAG: glycine cleavage system protein H, partial [Acidimicrobiia bacterium]